MQTSFDIATPTAAFVAGLITSVHCVGMCGPLSCAFFGGCTRHAVSQSFTYQAARVFSYTLLGGLAATIGAPFTRLFSNQIAHLFPWLLAILFIWLALDLKLRVPPSKLLAVVFQRIVGFSPRSRSACLGMVTPLLPCGPLYLLLGVSMAAGSTLDGMLLMLAFGLGTVPFYMLCQLPALKYWPRISPAIAGRVRRSLAAISAIAIIWRAVASSGAGLAWTQCH